MNPAMPSKDLVRRVVAARMRDPDAVEDLVQETLARVVASRDRVQGSDLGPYAAVIARDAEYRAKHSWRSRLNMAMAEP